MRDTIRDDNHIQLSEHTDLTLSTSSEARQAEAPTRQAEGSPEADGAPASTGKRRRRRRGRGRRSGNQQTNGQATELAGSEGAAVESAGSTSEAEAKAPQPQAEPAKENDAPNAKEREKEPQRARSHSGKNQGRNKNRERGRDRQRNKSRPTERVRNSSWRDGRGSRDLRPGQAQTTSPSLWAAWSAAHFGNAEDPTDD